MTLTRKHIVITVFGSLGDLHPMIALAHGLQQRGHHVTIATSTLYQEKIELEGIGFSPMRPSQIDYDKKIYDELFDPRWGPEVLMRKLLIPYVRETYKDLYPLLEKADFLINSPIVFAGSYAAEALNLPWASIALQPQLFFSSYDPPVMPILPVTEHMYNLGPSFWKPFLKWAKSTTDPWVTEIYALRKELGLPDRGNPIFEGHFSPHLNLAMFSKLMATPQPDWPIHSHVTGFVFYDQMKPNEQALPEAIQNFLSEGAPPVVFTLGSSVVNTAGNFYDVSIEAAKRLNCRAIFLAGDNQPTIQLTDKMLLWDYASYSMLFQHAAAIVHQGGMGTTAQVMRAGKPMIVVPRGFDQPDNAARVKRLGISRTIYPNQYKVARVVKNLEQILKSASYHEKALEIAHMINQEEGLSAACDVIENELRKVTNQCLSQSPA